MTFRLPLLLLALPLAGPALSAAEARNPNAEAEARLREALRDTTLRLRAAQGEAETLKAGLETARAQAAEQRRVREALERRAAEDIRLGSEHITALNARLERRRKEFEKTRDELNRTVAEARRLSELAARTESERARLDTLSRRLAVRVADREAKNVRLMKVSQEVLRRFEDFGLGDAIANREPFIGAKRAEIQTLVQDYRDRMEENKVRPGEAAPAEAWTSAPVGSSAAR